MYRQASWLPHQHPCHTAEPPNLTSSQHCTPLNQFMLKNTIPLPSIQTAPIHSKEE
ncbi:hypothetical protein BDV41DRAFT_556554 [Aspergillus transmontanensis]|uniref:Uncharacterized protein n=1 Tax=Aspergillus transmontanensis TaxID=1034304 RepID=A0A5N6VEU4_9EURO|nr:hypothetical protein BDV41DRAFT_556554 [Aspergillus transmontanensis]